LTSTVNGIGLKPFYLLVGRGHKVRKFSYPRALVPKELKPFGFSVCRSYERTTLASVMNKDACALKPNLVIKVDKPPMRGPHECMVDNPLLSIATMDEFLPSADSGA
jgi:hypothetical protein